MTDTIDRDMALEDLTETVKGVKVKAEKCFAVGVSPMTIFETITETLGVQIPAPFMLLAKKMAESAAQAQPAKPLAIPAAAADTL